MLYSLRLYAVLLLCCVCTVWVLCCVVLCAFGFCDGSTICTSREANNVEKKPHNLSYVNYVMCKHMNQTNNTRRDSECSQTGHVSDALSECSVFVGLIFIVFAIFTSQRRVGGISSLIRMPCFLIPTQLMLRFPTLGESLK